MSNPFDEKHPAPQASGVRTNSSDDAMRRGTRKGSVVDMLKSGYGLAEKPGDLDEASLKVGIDLTHRKLKPRHIQLIGIVHHYLYSFDGWLSRSGIGGTIGTALYVQIGRGLLNGGPGSLFLAFSIW